MTRTYSAGGSRRTVVLTAIVGFHIAVLYVIASDLGPGIGKVIIDVVPITPPAQKAPVKPVETIKIPGPLEVYFRPEPMPHFPTPKFPEPTANPTDRTVGPTVLTGPGYGPAGNVELVAPRLRMRGDKLAALINACYPAGSRRAGEEGRAVVQLLVGADGSVRSWSLVQGTGFARLDEAVPCIIRRLVIEPGRQDGRAVEAAAQLPIVFRLD